MKTKYNGAEKRSIWVWYCDKPHGGYLFRGNSNPVALPFHFGGIGNLVCGETLVCAKTRHALEMDFDISVWNHRFQDLTVEPRQITIEMHSYGKRGL